MISSVNNNTLINSNPSISSISEGAVHENLPKHQIDKRMVDRVDISDRARKLSEVQMQRVENPKSTDKLSDEEKREVERLRARDREVRAHERAHIAAGAGIIKSGASYEYDVGPDGKFYAVSGEVKIDVSEGKDPQITIQKMQRVKTAALAPSQPSATDRAVVAEASRIETKAKIELSREKTEENSSQKIKASEFPKNTSSIISAYSQGYQLTGDNISTVA